MTEFFIKTDAAVLGPFSGLELRELALAGILRPDSILSDSPQGPWQVAAGVGLFNEQKTPLPHPPNVQLARYQVRGMAGAFQGPFKLRELIGFAARGMLPADALLQADSEDDWVPVKRFRVLSACLAGDLVLLDENGRVIRRAVRATAHPIELAKTRAPIELTRPADERDSTAFAVVSDSTTNHVTPPPLPHELNVQRSEETNEAQLGSISRWMDRIRERLPNWEIRERISQWIPLRRLVPLTLAILVMVGAGAAYSYWTGRPMPRRQVLGEWWISNTAETDSPHVSGIAFRVDGKCVFFDPWGVSWSGDFQWVEQGNATQSFHSIAPIQATIDDPDPSHPIEQVRPTDGYLRLSGLAKELPRLDGHPVRELLVRRDAGSLQLGYPTSIEWTTQGRTMLAAWVSAAPSAFQPQNARAKIPVDAQPSELIAKFGIPDEARQIYRFELGENPVELENAQIIRYRDQKFAITSDGHLKDVSVVPTSTAP